MSRIGNSPISIPEGVTVNYTDGFISVKGKLGELNQFINSDQIEFKITDNTLSLIRNSESKDTKAKHGLYRSLVNNMVQGVSTGFKKQLELRGVGYRASMQGNNLDISIGYSHNVVFSIPSEIKVTAETEKGKAPIITIFGCDKQLVGSIAARIRAERKPEPYKGKGIRYVGEYVRKKAGKTAAS